MCCRGAAVLHSYAFSGQATQLQTARVKELTFNSTEEYVIWKQKSLETIVGNNNFVLEKQILYVLYE